MASVRKHPKSKYWYACVTGPDGKQRQFSTGLTERVDALAAATAAERALRHHAAEPTRLRMALDRIAEDFQPAAETTPAEHLKSWVAGRTGEITRNTLLAYRKVAAEAAAWFADRGIHSFHALTARALTELRDHWAATIAASTANKKFKFLKIMLAAAVKDHLMPNNPADTVGILRQAATNRREFTVAELEILLPSLPPEWRGMVMLGLYTGQRLNDLAALRWSSIDLAAGTIAFTAAKTKSLVALPLAAPALDAILALDSTDDPKASVFPHLAKLSAPARSNDFRKHLAAVGLALPVPKKADRTRSGKLTRQTSELSFHSLRHTATTFLKSAGVSDSIARAIIGHQSAAVSRVYTHFDLATMRGAIDKMPSVGQ